MRKIDIITPNRIGDSILALPALYCLKQLIERYEPDSIIQIISTNALSEVFSKLDICKVKTLSPLRKLCSNLNPADEAVFLFSSSKTLFYKAKKTYGYINTAKKYLKYDEPIQFLSVKEIDQHLPKEFIDYFKNKFGFSSITVGYIATCLKLGFTFDQIKETFKFDLDIINLGNIKKLDSPVSISGDYIVICMEAAYGKNGDKDRHWDLAKYLEVINSIYNVYSIKSVLIGIDDSVKFPDSEHIIDLRKKLNLEELTKTILDSKAYIGNDTGPLHIANLMKKTSVGIYARENTLYDYSPIFPSLNTKLFRPSKASEVFEGFRSAYSLLEK